MTTDHTPAAAVAGPVELPVRPRVWARKDQLQHASTRGGLLCAMYPHTKGRADLEPLYDQAALDAAVARAVAAECERNARIVERINGWVGTREIAAEIRGETQILRA